MTAVRPTVAVLGDSITVEQEAELRAALAAATDVELIAYVGRSGHTFGDLLPDAEQVAATRPDIVVVNLGTNDALKAVPVAETSRDLEAVHGCFPQARIVAVAVTTRFSGSDFDLRAEAVNRRLRAGRRDGGRPAAVVAWDEIVAADDAGRGAAGPDRHPEAEPSEGQIPEPLLSDGLHPTPRGRVRLAELIAAAVAEVVASDPRWCAAAGTTRSPE